MNGALFEALRPFAASWPRILREQEILRVAATVAPAQADRDILEIRRNVLTWVQKRSGSRLPDRAWLGETFDQLAGGRNSSAVRLRDGGTDIWAVRAEDPDKSVAGRIWTTEFVLGREGNAPPRIGVRLFVNTSEQEIAIEPHTPGFMQALSSNCNLAHGPVEILAEPILIEDEDAASGLVELLVDQRRSLPIFVLSIPEHGSTPLIDAGALARAVLGMASVIVVPSRFTWHFTRRLEQQRSVFNGAVRAYLPGFSPTADPYAHRLELSDRLAQPGGAERCQRWMRILAAEYSLRHLALGRDVLDFKEVRSLESKLEQERLLRDNASDTEQLIAARRRIAALESQLADAQSHLDYFSEEHKAAEARAAAAEQQLDGARWTIQQLADTDRGADGPLLPDADVPKSWSEVARWCDRSFAGRLVLTQSARRGLRRPAFLDMELVMRCLRWLAVECRDRRRGGGHGTLSNITIESGVSNAPCGADSYEIRHNGRDVLVDWHIKSGGNTRDPSRCLRIYYLWEEDTQQIIVADLPEHRRTGAS